MSQQAKVVIGINTRLSCTSVRKPKSVNGGKEKYSVSLIIPRSNKKTITAVKEVIDAAIQEDIGKFGGKRPNKATLKLPLRDGDVGRDDEAYQNSYFINANSITTPQVADKHAQPILDRTEVYSGCYAQVSINFYTFNINNNRGIACGLGSIQKVRDRKPLGGHASTSDDFIAIDDDSDDDFLS